MEKLDDKFEDKTAGELVQMALGPLLWAQRQLVEAENIMVEKGLCKAGEKSEIRQRFEKYEANVKQAWEIECEKYGVKPGYVLDLPKDVYKRVCEDYIQKPGLELLNWLFEKTEEWRKWCDPPWRNPFIVAICALQKSYNIFGED